MRDTYLQPSLLCQLLQVGSLHLVQALRLARGAKLAEGLHDATWPPRWARLRAVSSAAPVTVRLKRPVRTAPCPHQYPGSRTVATALVFEVIHEPRCILAVSSNRVVKQSDNRTRT